MHPSVGVAAHGVASGDSAGEGGGVSNHNSRESRCDLHLWWYCIKKKKKKEHALLLHQGIDYVWLHNSMTRHHFKILLENVQLFALRIATKPWSEQYSTLTSRFQLPTLSSHRSYHKLLCTYKFVNGYSFCPSGLFITILTPDFSTLNT